MINKLLNSALANLNEICDLGGRLAGTEEERRALDLAAAILERGGTVIRRHPVSYDGWQCEDAGITIAGSAFQTVALPGSIALPGGAAELEVIDAGRGTLEELEALAPSIPGRAVMVHHEYMFAPDHIHRCKKSERILELGAALFIIANPDPESGPVTGGIMPAMPALGVDHATSVALAHAAAARKPVQFNLVAGRREMQTETLDLLVPAQSGAHAQEIVICAHIDGHSISESAMDNASGAAVVLALAEHYQQSPLEDYAIRFLIFSAEEIALCGSDDYVAKLDADGRQRIKAVLNLDCVAGDLNFGAITNGFDGMASLVRSASKALGLEVSVLNELVRNSDHYAFASAGVPALRLTAGFGQRESRLRYVLTGGDTRDLIATDEVSRALCLAQEMVRQLEAGITDLPPK